MADDEAFVVRAQTGDKAAFAMLVDRHGLYVYNLALRVLRRPEEAQEVAQEAFVRAWRGLPAFQRTAQFQTWLYRIVVNLCYNRLPQIKQELNRLVTDSAAHHLADPRQQVETDLLSAELQAVLHQAIDELPEQYRLLITLRYLQELSYNEIVEVTSLPLGTVKTGIHRARALLRSALEGYEGEV